jgi:hypothetical protein
VLPLLRQHQQFQDEYLEEIIAKKAIDKAKIATDLDHKASAMKDPKDREAQVGSPTTVPEQALP